MARILYTLLLYTLLPVLLVRQWWRGRLQTDGSAALAARLGFVAPVAGKPVWLHCVSVGETVAAEPLVSALREQGLPLLLTNTTFTGAQRVRQRFDKRLPHRYMPFDTPVAVARFLDRVQPRALVILETELWPNLIAACAKRAIPVLLVNARLSARSARGYARFPVLAGGMLQNLTAIAAQAQPDADRFLALGVRQDRVQVTGNLKFDLGTQATDVGGVHALHERIGARPVWVAASTHAGEDEILLDAHRLLMRDFPDALLVLVPRHPERFAQVAALVARREFSCARRSRQEVPAPATAVYLGDTMGEMPLYYGIAGAAFVGGSLLPIGGHNFLEPAALGLPLLAGPHCFNFQSIADELAAAGALSLVEDSAMIAAQLTLMLGDESRRAVVGAAARGYVEKNRGACQRTMRMINAALALPAPRH